MKKDAPGGSPPLPGSAHDKSPTANTDPATWYPKPFKYYRSAMTLQKMIDEASGATVPLQYICREEQDNWWFTHVMHPYEQEQDELPVDAHLAFSIEAPEGFAPAVIRKKKRVEEVKKLLVKDL